MDAAGVGRFPLIGFSQGSKASVRRISESPALADALKAAEAARIEAERRALRRIEITRADEIALGS
jgi:hypothetical protein